MRQQHARRGRPSSPRPAGAPCSPPRARRSPPPGPAPTATSGRSAPGRRRPPTTAAGAGAGSRRRGRPARTARRPADPSAAAGAIDISRPRVRGLVGHDPAQPVRGRRREEPVAVAVVELDRCAPGVADTVSQPRPGATRGIGPTVSSRAAHVDDQDEGARPRRGKAAQHREPVVAVGDHQRRAGQRAVDTGRRSPGRRARSPGGGRRRRVRSTSGWRLGGARAPAAGRRRRAAGSAPAGRRRHRARPPARPAARDAPARAARPRAPAASGRRRPPPPTGPAATSATGRGPGVGSTVERTRGHAMPSPWPRAVASAGQRGRQQPQHVVVVGPAPGRRERRSPTAPAVPA